MNWAGRHYGVRLTPVHAVASDGTDSALRRCSGLLSRQDEHIAIRIGHDEGTCVCVPMKYPGNL
jgi:hypothetical protein